MSNNVGYEGSYDYSMDRIDSYSWATNYSAYAGSHSHTITTDSINGGVTQEPIDITPMSLSVNQFVYLGD